jgi:hypothetical protein
MTRSHQTIAVACLLATTLGLASTSAQAFDRRIRLINNSNRTIDAFYSSNVDSGYWGGDHLGQYVVPPGYSIVIDLDDDSGYCRFDLRTVMDDGTEVVRSNVDVCTVATYEID